MKVLLLTPPHTNPIGPTLGIAVLSAHLKKAFPQYDIQAIDQGLDAMHWLLSDKTIEYGLSKIEHYIAELEEKESLVYEEQINYARYKGALSVLSVYGPEVQSQIRILQNKKSYSDNKKRNKANFIINKVLEHLAIAWPGTFLNAGDYRTQLSPFSVSDIQYYVNHPEDSIYNSFFDEWLQLNPLDGISMLGISIAFAKQVLPAFLFASKVRKCHPEIHIVIGGSMMAHLNNEFFHPLFQWCECIIQREGEYPLEHLVRAYGNGIPLSEEYGAIYLNDDGEMVKCKKSPKVDLVNEPTPDFSGFRLKGYMVPSPVIPLQLGRSCYWGKCTFCCLNTAFEHKNCWSSVKKITDDIELLVRKQSIETIEFVDDAIPPVFARGLSEELLKRKCKVKWFCYARFDRGFDRDLLELMHRAGCVGLKFGLESASPRVSKMMNKGIDIDYAGMIFQMASEVGIIPQAAFFYGFPGEKKEDIWETAFFIKEHVVNNGIIAYNGIFRLLKSMPLINEPEKYGIQSVKKWNVKEELIDYYEVRMIEENDLQDEIHKAELFLSGLIALDLTRSVDLRRYWFAGYGTNEMDFDMTIGCESCFPLEFAPNTQDCKNGDFLPGKGIYAQKSYISPGLHSDETIGLLNRCRKRMVREQKKKYVYNIGTGTFSKT